MNNEHPILCSFSVNETIMYGGFAENVAENVATSEFYASIDKV